MSVWEAPLYNQDKKKAGLTVKLDQPSIPLNVNLLDRFPMVPLRFPHLPQGRLLMCKHFE